MSRTESDGITAVSLSYKYGRRKGAKLGPLDFSTHGEPTLLLGANGAGKTTLMRLLAGELNPDAGEILVGGKVIYVPQKFQAVKGFTCREYVGYVGWLWGAGRREAKKNSVEALRLTGLESEAGSRCDRLSEGQKARLQLASALNSGAANILLDEPAAALDPVTRAQMSAIYRDIIADGRSIVVSTHNAEDVGTPFRRVAVLESGAIIYQGGLADFLHSDHENPGLALLSGILKNARSEI